MNRLQLARLLRCQSPQLPIPNTPQLPCSRLTAQILSTGLSSQIGFNVDQQNKSVECPDSPRNQSIREKKFANIRVLYNNLLRIIYLKKSKILIFFFTN